MVLSHAVLGGGVHARRHHRWSRRDRDVAFLGVVRGVVCRSQGGRARHGREEQRPPDHGASPHRGRQCRRNGQGRDPGDGPGGSLRAPGRAQAAAPARGEPRGDGQVRRHRAHRCRRLRQGRLRLGAAGVGRRQGRSDHQRQHRPAQRCRDGRARVRAAAGAGAGGPGQEEQGGPDRPGGRPAGGQGRGRGAAGAGRHAGGGGAVI